jgi:hypothetical protein
VIKRVFGTGRVLVTTVKRIGLLMMVAAFAFNLYQLCTLKMPKSSELAGSINGMQEVRPFPGHIALHEGETRFILENR